MAFRKQSSKQPHTGDSVANLSDNTPDAQDGAVVAKSSLTTSKKAAWLEAPLPQFCNPELAVEMVKEGYYRSIDEAYLEVPAGVLSRVRQRVETYLLHTHPATNWRNAPLPSPKK